MECQEALAVSLTIEPNSWRCSIRALTDDTQRGGKGIRTYLGNRCPFLRSQADSNSCMMVHTTRIELDVR